jgi:hypothetical protein
MTKSSTTRVEKRLRVKRGRPASDTKNQLAVDVAAALHLINEGVSRQAAGDFALALMEAKQVDPSKKPRRRRPDDWVLTGYELPVSFRERSKYLRKRVASGKIKPRAEIVIALALALRGKNEVSIGNCIRHLALLAAISESSFRQALDRLSHQKPLPEKRIYSP